MKQRTSLAQSVLFVSLPVLCCRPMQWIYFHLVLHSVKCSVMSKTHMTHWTICAGTRQQRLMTHNQTHYKAFILNMEFSLFCAAYYFAWSFTERGKYLAVVGHRLKNGFLSSTKQFLLIHYGSFKTAEERRRSQGSWDVPAALNEQVWSFSEAGQWHSDVLSQHVVLCQHVSCHCRCGCT